MRSVASVTDDVAARGLGVHRTLRAFHGDIARRAARDDADADRHGDLEARVADTAANGLDLEREARRRQAGANASTLGVGADARFAAIPRGDDDVARDLREVTTPVRLNANVVSIRDWASCSSSRSRSRSRLRSRARRLAAGRATSARARPRNRDDLMRVISLGAVRQQRCRPQELELLVERTVQLIAEEPTRRILRQRSLALRNGVVDDLQVRFDDRRRPRIELRACASEDRPQAIDLVASTSRTPAYSGQLASWRARWLESGWCSRPTRAPGQRWIIWEPFERCATVLETIRLSRLCQGASYRTWQVARGLARRSASADRRSFAAKPVCFA